MPNDIDFLQTKAYIKENINLNNFEYFIKLLKLSQPVFKNALNSLERRIIHINDIAGLSDINDTTITTLLQINDYYSIDSEYYDAIALLNNVNQVYYGAMAEAVYNTNYYLEKNSIGNYVVKISVGITDKKDKLFSYPTITYFKNLYNAQIFPRLLLEASLYAIYGSPEDERFLANYSLNHTYTDEEISGWPQLLQNFYKDLIKTSDSNEEIILNYNTNYKDDVNFYKIFLPPSELFSDTSTNMNEINIKAGATEFYNKCLKSIIDLDLLSIDNLYSSLIQINDKYPRFYIMENSKINFMNIQTDSYSVMLYYRKIVTIVHENISNLINVFSLFTSDYLDFDDLNLTSTITKTVMLDIVFREFCEYFEIDYDSTYRLLINALEETIDRLHILRNMIISNYEICNNVFNVKS